MDGAAFVWLAFELHRDAGDGKKSLQIAQNLGAEALADAKAANDRAWTFEPEFRDKSAELSSSSAACTKATKETLAYMQEIDEKINSMKNELIDEIQREIKSNYQNWANANSSRIEQDISTQIHQMISLKLFEHETSIRHARRQLDLDRQNLSKMIEEKLQDLSEKPQ